MRKHHWLTIAISFALISGCSDDREAPLAPSAIAEATAEERAEPVAATAYDNAGVAVLAPAQQMASSASGRASTWTIETFDDADEYDWRRRKMRITSPRPDGRSHWRVQLTTNEVSNPHNPGRSI